jgi:hypothetical protein
MFLGMTEGDLHTWDSGTQSTQALKCTSLGEVEGQSFIHSSAGDTWIFCPEIFAWLIP